MEIYAAKWSCYKKLLWQLVKSGHMNSHTKKSCCRKARISSSQTSKESRANDRSKLMRSDQLNLWTKPKLQESYYHAKQGDDQRMSAAQTSRDGS